MSDKDFTAKDFDSLLLLLRNNIIRYLPEWTDHNDSDMGIALLQLFCRVADILHFYLNKNIKESFLPTVFERKNLINLLKLIDYELFSAAAASVDLKFTLSQTYPEAVTIPAGTELQSIADPAAGIESLFFETDVDLVIAIGLLEGTVGATEGRSGLENIGTSTGLVYQSFQIFSTPIIDGTLKVLVNGVEWTEVDTLALSAADAQEYNIQRDEDDKITVFFGDNSQGLIPPNTHEITCTFRVGGGVKGNLAKETITIINSSLTHLGSPLSATVTNEAAASGGTDREASAQAKVNGPRSLRALNRAVTDDDYEVLSESFAGVERAKVFALEPFNYRVIDLFIIPGGGGLPSQTLIDNLTAFLETKRMVLDFVTVKPPDYIDVNLKLTAFVLANHTQTTVQAAVNAAIDNFFIYTSEFIDFGKGIFLSDLYHLIDAITGIDHVDIEELNRVSVVKFVVWSGGATVSAIQISSTTLEEEWTVQMTSPTAFKVTGSVSGLQTATGTFDSEYTSDNGEVVFTVTSGAPASVIGDRFTFKTSKLLGNIGMDGSEFPQKGTVTLSMSGGL